MEEDSLNCRGGTEFGCVLRLETVYICGRTFFGSFLWNEMTQTFAANQVLYCNEKDRFPKIRQSEALFKWFLDESRTSRSRDTALGHCASDRIIGSDFKFGTSKAMQVCDYICLFVSAENATTRMILFSFVGRHRLASQKCGYASIVASSRARSQNATKSLVRMLNQIDVQIS